MEEIIIYACIVHNIVASIITVEPPNVHNKEYVPNRLPTYVHMYALDPYMIRVVQKYNCNHHNHL